MATRWLLRFWLRMRYPYTAPDFLTLPIECKWCTMVERSQFITFTSSGVHWRGSLLINVFKRPSLPYRSSLTWSVTNVKIILLKTRQPFSWRALSDGIVPIHGTNVSGRLRCFRPSLNSEEYVGNVPILHLALHFLASTAPFTIFKWENFNL